MLRLRRAGTLQRGENVRGSAEAELEVESWKVLFWKARANDLPSPLVTAHGKVGQLLWETIE